MFDLIRMKWINKLKCAFVYVCVRRVYLCELRVLISDMKSCLTRFLFVICLLQSCNRWDVHIIHSISRWFLLLVLSLNVYSYYNSIQFNSCDYSNKNVNGNSNNSNNSNDHNKDKLLLPLLWWCVVVLATVRFECLFFFSHFFSFFRFCYTTFVNNNHTF